MFYLARLFFHAYVDRDTCARIEKGKLITRPVHELYPMLKPKQQKKLRRDVRWVYETVIRQPLTGEFIREEYELPRN